ncbi:MAG: HAD hydrolase family protein [Planctomycetes bacterium]|nr:HAD hydrolase family protein [Planctomycetota bacterium]MCB9919198.1 HAD hydrolase family protein [Planctomycetota bacterium]
MYVPQEIDLDALPAHFRSVARDIRFVLLDVDGILTDGRLHFDADGREMKSIHAHDASGIVHWQRAGHEAGLLSGRRSRGIQERADELGMIEVHLGKLDKLSVYEDLLARRGLDDSVMCYFGDDLLDIPVLRRVALPITVPQARPDTRKVCQYVTRAPAGHGAVREVIEVLLRIQGHYDAILESDGRPPKEFA